MKMADFAVILKKCGRIVFFFFLNRQTRREIILQLKQCWPKVRKELTKWQNVKYAVKRQLSVTPEVFHSARQTGHSTRTFSASPLWKTGKWWKRHCAPSASAPWRKAQNKRSSFYTEKQTAGGSAGSLLFPWSRIPSYNNHLQRWDPDNFFICYPTGSW